MPKKIIILALIRFIELEEQFDTFQLIIEYSLSYLKSQYERSKTQLKKVTAFEVKPRKFDEERLV